jgi:hypothetical protein
MAVRVHDDFALYGSKDDYIINTHSRDETPTGNQSCVGGGGVIFQDFSANRRS